MFNIGDKVVCVDASNWLNKDLYKRCGYNVMFPVQDGVYTVREIKKTKGVYGILVEEIINPLMQPETGQAYEAIFRASRFIKLSDLSEMEDALAEAKQILEFSNDYKPFP
jgi:hypothetical protein